MFGNGQRHLSVVLIGTGFIATHKHLPAWRRLRHKARVVALCDLDRARAEAVARRFDIPRVYADVGEMLAREQPDIVDICTPPKTHMPLAIQALEAGSHVLIEKPMAVTVEECDRIIQTARATGRKVCVIHSDLFYPAFMRAREMVAKGAIGTFTGMHIFLATPVSYITSKPEHWAHRLPGGVLGETGPHSVYLTLAFINPIRDVQIHAQKIFSEYPWSPFEDYRYTLIGDHAVSSVTLTYTTDQWAAKVDLWGTRGILRIDLESQSLIHYRRPSLNSTTIGFSSFREAWETVTGTLRTGLQVLTRRFQSTHEVLIRKFLESIRNGVDPPVSPEEGREAVRVMDLLVRKLEVKNQKPGTFP